MEISDQQYIELFGSSDKELALNMVKNLLLSGLLPHEDIIYNHATGEIRVQQFQFKQIKAAMEQCRQLQDG